MFVIAGSGGGVIVKFETVKELQVVVEHLSGMLNWAEAEIGSGNPVKLAYAMLPDAVSSQEKSLLALIELLPDAGVA
jgi:hypothetical protein